MSIVKRPVTWLTTLVLHKYSYKCSNTDSIGFQITFYFCKLDLNTFTTNYFHFIFMVSVSDLESEWLGTFRVRGTDGSSKSKFYDIEFLIIRGDDLEQNIKRPAFVPSLSASRICEWDFRSFLDNGSTDRFWSVDLCPRWWTYYESVTSNKLHAGPLFRANWSPINWWVIGTNSKMW